MSLSAYRSVWRADASSYARWVRELAGQHGVYVVREARDTSSSPATLYVGESHTGNLRETLQRHFQRWNGATAGPTFDRNLVEVAVEVVAIGEDAVTRQDDLIRSLRPLLNRQEPVDWRSRLTTARNETTANEGDEDEAAYEDVAGFFDELAGGAAGR